jgi:hypothetical protein
MVPIAPIASEPRGLDAVDSADRPSAHRSNRFLESGSQRQSGSGATEIIVDDGDRREAGRVSGFNQRILAALALGPSLIDGCTWPW